MCWPVLLWLQKTHEDIVSEDFEHFEVVHLETFFERCIELMWSEELVQAWLTEKSDIPALQKDNMRLFIMSEKLPDITEIGSEVPSLTVAFQPVFSWLLRPFVIFYLRY